MRLAVAERRRLAWGLADAVPDAALVQTAAGLAGADPAVGESVPAAAALVRGAVSLDAVGVSSTSAASGTPF